MSFAVDARKVRNPELPVGRRVSGLHSCVQRYHPLGFLATLSFLEQVAGPYKQDEKALLKAIEVLTESRERWKQAVDEYATERRAAKARGERTPRPYDPNPSPAPDQWYGAARFAALHALAFRQLRGLLPPPIDDVAADVHALVTSTLASGGHLTPDERSLLVDLTAELRRRIRTRKDKSRTQATDLLQVTRFITTATS